MKHAQLVRIIGGGGGGRWRITRNNDGEHVIEREGRDQMGSKFWFTVHIDHAKPIVQEAMQMLLHEVARTENPSSKAHPCWRRNESEEK